MSVEMISTNTRRVETKTHYLLQQRISGHWVTVVRTAKDRLPLPAGVTAIGHS